MKGTTAETAHGSVANTSKLLHVAVACMLIDDSHGEHVGVQHIGARVARLSGGAPVSDHPCRHWLHWLAMAGLIELQPLPSNRRALRVRDRSGLNRLIADLRHQEHHCDSC